MKISVINGPSLHSVSDRRDTPYGGQSLSAIENRMEERADEYGWELEFYRTNHEGEIIDLLHRARLDSDAVILNAAAYSYYSYAISDAIAAIDIPVIEVHMSNINAVRGSSVLSPVCKGTIAGFGAASYILAMEALVEMVD